MVTEGPSTNVDEGQAEPIQLRIATAFKPAAPIDQVNFFAGRIQQLRDVLDAIAQSGQHAVIYGERGVGKTSLAAVISEIIRMGKFWALGATCDGTDSFSTIWTKVFEEAELENQLPGIGFSPEPQLLRRTAADLLPNKNSVSPNDVRRALEILARSGDRTVVVFIDEFDRLDDATSRTLFADTVKTLSDHLVGATVVLVGVADNVDELIAEHRSIERALAQIHMPRMSREELTEIVRRGLNFLSMEIEDSALARITGLSQGLPHYTHLLAQSAARAAVDQKRSEIAPQDVDAAIARALDRAQESIISAYHRATLSTRDNLYKQVLLACAMAHVDDLGYFSAGDVRGPLTAIMKRRYDIPAFARHLIALSEPQRGPVLQKSGFARKFRFRFVNPLLQPYVIMRGLADGTIDNNTLDRFSGRAA